MYEDWRGSSLGKPTPVWSFGPEEMHKRRKRDVAPKAIGLVESSLA